VVVAEVVAEVTMQHTTTGRWTIMAMLPMAATEVLVVVPEEGDMLWTIDPQNVFRVSAAALKAHLRFSDSVFDSLSGFPCIGVRRASGMGWRRVPHTSYPYIMITIQH
jgi:hypothetical protein